MRRVILAMLLAVCSSVALVAPAAADPLPAYCLENDPPVGPGSVVCTP